MSQQNFEKLMVKVHSKSHVKNNKITQDKEQHIENSVDQACDKCVEKHINDKPRPDVINIYQKSHIYYSTLYKKLAQ